MAEWRPRTNKRKPGRAKTRWKDDIQEYAGVLWMIKASKRNECKIYEGHLSIYGIIIAEHVDDNEYSDSMKGLNQMYRKFS